MSDGGGVCVVDPEALPDPVIGEAETRDCQLMDEHNNVRWVRCLVPTDGPHVAFAFIRTLRECIYGVVRHGVTVELHDGFYRYRLDRPVAIKCMRKAVISEQRGRLEEDPLRELAALQLLAHPGHPNVQFLAACLQDEDCIYSVCPFYSGGELFSFMEQRGAGLPTDQARAFFVQIMLGLEYMHSRRVCHRDLSLENVLLGPSQNCVVIDMGLCLRIPSAGAGDGRRVKLRRREQMAGKMSYIAPEVVAREDFDFSIDVWGAGVILFILLSGVPPVETASAVDPRFRMIASGRLGELLDMWGLYQIDASARDLLARLLHPQPDQRLTVAEVLQHPWVLRPA